MVNKVRVKSLDLEQIIDRLLTKNYVKIDAQTFYSMDTTTYNTFINQGYILYDLSGLFPNNPEYSKNYFFIPRNIYTFSVEE